MPPRAARTKPPVLASIEDLTPNPRNPRTIDDEASRGLRKSLETFGDLSGVVYNRRTGRLVTGHQRIQQMKELGGQYRDGAIWIGEDSYSVRVVDWPEEKEKAALVTANNPKIQGVWTAEIEDILREIRVEFQEDFFDLGLEALADSMRIVGENDPIAEWKAMPEFAHEDKTAFRSIVVHFKDQAAVDLFAKQNRQRITESTKFVWFPEIEIERMMDKLYVAEPEE